MKCCRPVAKISTKSSDLGGSDLSAPSRLAEVLGGQGQTKVYTVTLTTNSYKFAGVGHNSVLMQWLVPHDGSADGWTDEVLFNHSDIAPGEVVAKTFTITGRPQALRLMNRGLDGYVFDKPTVEEEGQEPLVVAQRTPQSPHGWGTLLSKKRDDWFGAKESMEFQIIGATTNTTPATKITPGTSPPAPSLTDIMPPSPL